MWYWPMRFIQTAVLNLEVRLSADLTVITYSVSNVMSSSPLLLFNATWPDEELWRTEKLVDFQNSWISPNKYIAQCVYVCLTISNSKSIQASANYLFVHGSEHKRGAYRPSYLLPLGLSTFRLAFATQSLASFFLLATKGTILQCNVGPFDGWRSITPYL